jgi:hypothetical protein
MNWNKKKKKKKLLIMTIIRRNGTTKQSTVELEAMEKAVVVKMLRKKMTKN